MKTIDLVLASKTAAEQHHNIIGVLLDEIGRNAINNARLLDAARAANDILIAVEESRLGDESKAAVITADHLASVRDKLCAALRIADIAGY